jgi:hypothetical protein
MNVPSYITVRKHSFLSSAALGFSAVVITLLLTSTTVVLYTVHVASAKSEQVITLAQSAVKGLPELVHSLPPALADILDDQRRPDYCTELTISARTIALPDPHGRMRTTVEIVNNGPEVVSLLALRILILDAEDQLLCESQEYAATPFAADDGWRGPIMPGSHRRFVTHRSSWQQPDSTGGLHAEVEVTELRVWNNPKDAAPPQPTTASVPTPAQTPEQG